MMFKMITIALCMAASVIAVAHGDVCKDACQTAADWANLAMPGTGDFAFASCVERCDAAELEASTDFFGNPIAQCADSLTFTDAKGYGCSGWLGYAPCNKYNGYSDENMRDIRAHCGATCNSCSVAPNHDDDGGQSVDSTSTGSHTAAADNVDPMSSQMDSEAIAEAEVYIAEMTTSCEEELRAKLEPEATFTTADATTTTIPTPQSDCKALCQTAISGGTDIVDDAVGAPFSGLSGLGGIVDGISDVLDDAAQCALDCATNTDPTDFVAQGQCAAACAGVEVPDIGDALDDASDAAQCALDCAELSGFMAKAKCALDCVRRARRDAHALETCNAACDVTDGLADIVNDAVGATFSGLSGLGGIVDGISDVLDIGDALDGATDAAQCALDCAELSNFMAKAKCALGCVRRARRGAHSCTWVRNNENTVGEGEVKGFSGTRSQCIDAVRQHCPDATIANYGDDGDCWCQYGVDMTPDPDEDYVNCLLSEMDSPCVALSEHVEEMHNICDGQTDVAFIVLCGAVSDAKIELNLAAAAGIEGFDAPELDVTQAPGAADASSSVGLISGFTGLVIVALIM